MVETLARASELSLSHHTVPVKFYTSSFLETIELKAVLNYHCVYTAMLASKVRLAIRPIPLSSIPPQLVKLPPAPIETQASSSKARSAANSVSSPTIEKLLNSFANRARHHKSSSLAGGLSADGRGLANVIPGTDAGVPGASPSSGNSSVGAQSLPPNLRIEEFVPKRKEYAGVKAAHRSLVSTLSRERTSATPGSRLRLTLFYIVL